MSIADFSSAVRYVGCDDTTIDLFESQYPVPNGVSYNSYVILDEKTAIMDTVDGRATWQWLENVEQALNGRTPDYLVVHHLEPDHAANIQTICEKYPQLQIVTSVKAAPMLPQFFTMDFNHRVTAVKEGDTLCLGAHTLTFVMAPMVHWPEVMVSYESAEKILFSADGFGTFGAISANEEWIAEARRYFINIVGKYGAPVQALLKKAAALDIKTICPLHGPVLTENLGYYLDKYNTWSSYQPEDQGTVIAYASIHGNTAAAARKMQEILESRGEHTVLLDVCRADKAVVVENAFRYDKLVLMACTYDGGLFTPMATLLYTLGLKAYQNRKVGLVENGSWAPCAGRIMKAELEKMKRITLCPTTVTIRSTVKDDTLAALNQLADELLG